MISTACKDMFTELLKSFLLSHVQVKALYGLGCIWCEYIGPYSYWNPVSDARAATSPAPPPPSPAPEL